MKLSNIVSLTSNSAVNSGENIPNVFTTKDQHKKNKKLKLKKSTYGGVGLNIPVPPAGCSDCVVGDAGSGGDGGGDGG